MSIGLCLVILAARQGGVTALGDCFGKLGGAQAGPGPVSYGAGDTIAKACGGERLRGKAPAAVGRWNGSAPTANSRQWDFYPGGELRQRGGYKGQWTRAGDAIAVDFPGGTRYRGRIIGKVLCGIRLDRQGEASGSFWLNRTADAPPAPGPAGNSL